MHKICFYLGTYELYLSGSWAGVDSFLCVTPEGEYNASAHTIFHLEFRQSFW